MTSAHSHEHAHPVLVEVTRGPLVESRHRASYVVVDSDGHVVQKAGEVEHAVYPRSAIKPVQALALVETGAAEAFGCSDAEVALACASHDGEPGHTEAVAAWLHRIGLGEQDLECGTHLPYHEPTMVALLKSGQEPSQLHNNCSGKHSGFLTVARHLGGGTKGYIKREHPVQQRVLGAIETMSGLDLGRAPVGIDGCGIPTVGIPLGNLALAMAQLADPKHQPEARQAACARIRQAVALHPFMVAGTRRFCTKVMEVTRERALVKTGAEGVYCAVLPTLGFGVALKVDDGAGRAAEVLMGRLLHRLGILSDDEATQLSAWLTPQIRNRAGLDVGEIRPLGPISF